MRLRMGRFFLYVVENREKADSEFIRKLQAGVIAEFELFRPV